MSAAPAPPLAALRSVRVGTTNEPKLAAVRDALAAYAPGARVEGLAVETGVAEQPVGFEEIVRGARNRAARAAAGGDCDLAIGIEDGLVELPSGAPGAGSQLVNVGCAAVTDGRRFSLGFTSGFAYPPACAERAAREREPIGALFDRLWQERRGERDALPSGRAQGNVGKLTLGALPRREYARHAVLCALVSFLHPDLPASGPLPRRGGPGVSPRAAAAGDDQAPVESVEQLVDFLRRWEKPPERWRVGTEHEKIGLYEDGLRPIPYEGERGIGSVLERIAELDGWRRIREGDNVIALEKSGASITLEPGGQLELSGAPLRTIHETCDEFHAHLALMKRVCDPLGIVWLGLGMDPFHEAERRPAMPKTRYRIMRRYLPTRGTLALEMMFATATVQANFDYADEADMADKMRTAMGLSPIVSAIFANSSLSGGKANGFVSRRLYAWQHTDPDRAGLLERVFQPDFDYRSYVEWALDVPLFFVVRGHTYQEAGGATFRQFMRDGLAETRATLADFDTHLTTLFPDVRLKHIIEVRGADAVPPGLTCSLPALWKGVLYDAEARRAGWELVAAASFPERQAARADAARRGLAGSHAGHSLLDLARELAAVSGEGLRRIGHAGRRDPDERCYLDPVREQLERGASPGQVVLERWEGEWDRSPDRLLEYARY